MVYFVEGKKYSGHKPRSSLAYEREPTKFRFTQADLTAPPMMQAYISSACPWAHRVKLLIKLKDLPIKISIVSAYRDDREGWNFASEKDAKFSGEMAPTQDPLFGAKYLSELYLKSNPDYSGNITTPVLFDVTKSRIISNESADIIRYLDRALEPGPNATIKYRLFPDDQQKDIDEVSTWIQNNLSNAVYQAGLGKTQEAYQEAVNKVFACLDTLEEKLSSSRYLLRDDRLSIADICLFPTLARFDDVYFLLFKCSKRRLKSYSMITNYLRDVFQIPGVADTVDMYQIKEHYYTTFSTANPKLIAPLGTSVESFSRPHNRDIFFEGMAGKEHEQEKKSARPGEFVRGVSKFRSVITKTGQGEGSFKAENGRYHLIIANNCPWCHRVALTRGILGLEDVVSMDTLFYRRNAEKGWQFMPTDDELKPIELENREELLADVKTVDSVYGKKFVREIYDMFESKESSVPLLIDKKTNQIVNNESSEIIRMFALGFTEFHKPGAPTLYPEELPKVAWEIDRLNDYTYKAINNGAYKAGFTSNREAYEEAFTAYFKALGKLDAMLGESKYLLGEHVTEADIRLFPTIVRHDPVYYIRMRLNGKMIRDLPNLERWLRDMKQLPGVAESTNIAHCLYGYFGRTGNNFIPSLLETNEFY